MRVVVLNLGLSNISSVITAGEAIGTPFTAITTPEELAGADRVILPGVGAFPAAMQRLEAAGWPEALRTAAAAGVPILGICLGMQLLADSGREGVGAHGLGLIPGVVDALPTVPGFRIPHVGWNDVRIERPDPIVQDIPSGTDFYFVHSYGFRATNAGDVVATADHGGRFAAIVARGSAVGLQFHPEKSSKAGLTLLKNFVSAGRS